MRLRVKCDSSVNILKCYVHRAQELKINLPKLPQHEAEMCISRKLAHKAVIHGFHLKFSILKYSFPFTQNEYAWMFNSF